jgi:tetratricopeptide (TPR) repeat protein
VLHSLGEPDLALANLQELVECAERLGDSDRLLQAKADLANALWFSGDAVGALPIVKEALVMAEALGDVRHQITAGLDLGMISSSLGDHRGTLDALERAMDLLRGDLARDRLGRAFYPFVNIRRSLASSLSHLGHFDRALDLAAEAMTFSEAVKQPGHNRHRDYGDGFHTARPRPAERCHSAS